MVNSSLDNEERLDASLAANPAELHLPRNDQFHPQEGSGVGIVAIAVQFQQPEDLRETSEAFAIPAEALEQIRRALRLEMQDEMDAELERRTFLLRDNFDTKLRTAQQNAEDTISHIRHDLRTPLTNVKTRAYLLRRAAENLPEGETKDIILNHANVLERQIAAVTDSFADRDFGLQSANIYELRLDLVHGEEILKDLVSRFRPSMMLNNKVKLNWRIPENANFIGDIEKILSIYHILIDNSIKFTAAGIIEVVLELRKGQIILQVADSGCGVREELIPKMFERGESLPESETPSQPGATKGTGLGLHFAKKLTEAMGGYIHVESKRDELQHGTCITVVIPMQRLQTS